MKLVPPICLAVFLLSAGAAFSQDKTEAPAKTPVKKLSSVGGATGGNVLTDDQIAALLTEWTDEKTDAKLQFSASFGVRNVPADEKRKYVKSGKIPIRITCELDEVKEVKGKKMYKRQSGNSHLYILDSDGKIVDRKTVSLDKMCPS